MIDVPGWLVWACWSFVYVTAMFGVALLVIERRSKR